MSIFRNKILVKIIATLCICLTLINFGIPAKVYADDWGGMLITPVMLLLTSIADGIMDILHKTIQYQDLSLIRIADAPSWWEQWGKTALAWIVTAIVVLIAVAAIVVTAGAAATAVVAITSTIKVLFVIGTIELVSFSLTGVGAAKWTGDFVAEAITDAAFPETIYMPAYTLTPHHIFTNKVLLFDVNFFNPKPSKEITVPAKVYEKLGEVKAYTTTDYTNVSDMDFYDGVDGTTNIYFKQKEITNPEGDPWVKITDEVCYSIGITGKTISEISNSISGSTKTEFENIINEVKEQYKKATNKELDTTKCTVFGSRKEANNTSTYSEGGGILEICINNTDEVVIIVFYFGTKVIEKVNNITVVSTAARLKQTISKWYFLLRNLALLALMLILIYIGIKIVTNSTAGQKAKYKERLMDWLVAMCLLFIMQYIMIFAVELTEKFTEMIQGIDKESGTATFVPLTDNQINYIKETEGGQQETTTREEYTVFDGMGVVVKNGEKTYLAWLSDIMGKIKIKSQTSQEGTANWVGYSLCYIVLVLNTVFFVWTYLKRVLYMAFLTIIAPLVAAMYPIDKMNDGKAQAFDAWLKEYIFNLLIQPVHLIIYTVLVSSAYVLAASNPVYAVVSIGFIMPAEKLLRSFFGFNKAKTPGALGGAAGAAIAFTGLQRVMSFGRKADKHGKDKKDNDNAKIKFANSQGVNAKDAVANSVLGKNTMPTVRTQNNKPSGEEPPTSANKPQQQTEKQAQTASQAQTAAQEQAQAQARSTARTTGNASKGAQNANKNNEQSTKKRSIRRAAVGVGKRYGRLMGKRITDKIKNTSITKAAVRGLAGAYGAAAMGMAGLALGVASGDPSKAFQYTTAGVTGGYAAGKGLGGAAVDAVAVDKNQIKDEMEMEYYGEDYKKVKFEEAAEAMASDEKNIDTIRKLTSLSHEDAQEVLQTVGKSCYGSGIDKMEDIAAVYQMEKNGHSREEAMAALKFNQYLPSDLNKMGEEERNDHIARWTREYEEAGYENSGTLAEESMKLAEEINKIKSGLKKA